MASVSLVELADKVFPTWEEARDALFAQQAARGFVLSILRSHKHHKFPEIRARTEVGCHFAGKPREWKYKANKYKTTSKKCECNWKTVISYHSRDQHFSIAIELDEHNHEPKPKKTSRRSTGPWVLHESFAVSLRRARELSSARIDELSDSLRSQINRVLHANPELGFREFMAHDAIAAYVEGLGLAVTRRAHGLDTCFEAVAGEGSRQVVFCCEYDALPGIGHGCGHNLIATASVAAFLAAAHVLAELQLPGRLRLLGTPAEEGGGGKAVLIDKGAFAPPEDVAAAIMAHPMPAATGPGYAGLAGLMLLASHQFHVEFRGRAVHAAGEPWNGINALDAAVAAYSGAAMLRQQIRPDERIHAIIEMGGLAPNVIPDYTRMNWALRAPSIARSEKLFERVKGCIEAAALATGCKHTIIMSPTYSNLRVNGTLCDVYVDEMAKLGQRVRLRQDTPYTASTDMGNVSHLVPSFHGTFNIPTADGTAVHSRDFAVAASTDEAHAAAINSAKGMAMLALRILADGDVAAKTRHDFMQPDQLD